MSVNLESQLLSVMNVLVKAAVSEISQLFSESCAELRLHLTQSLRENDGLRTRMRLMRSEMFSLKLQNRTARPSSRCGPVRVNTPKPRSKVQPKPADSTPAVSQDQSIPVSEKSAIDEGPDIILIKDEDDEMTTSGHSFHNDKLGNTKGEEQKAANSQVQEAFINQSDFYNTSDPLAFSMPGMPTASHNLPPNDHMNVQSDFYAMSSTNQMESSPIIQSVVSLNQIMVPSGSECSSNSLVPKQKSDSKIFSCNLCQARFHTRNELNTHRVSHVGGSPITCTMCDEVFVSKNTLGIHMRIHTGEKPYVCLLCGKSFTQNGGLRIHLRTHSGEKPYSCSVCHTSFNNPSNLRRHKITHKTVMFPNVSL